MKNLELDFDDATRIGTETDKMTELELLLLLLCYSSNLFRSYFTLLNSNYRKIICAQCCQPSIIDFRSSIFKELYSKHRINIAFCTHTRAYFSLEFLIHKRILKCTIFYCM